MSNKLIAIFIAALIVVGGAAYVVGVAEGQGDKKASESAAMMKQKDEDSAAMKLQEAAAMKKQDEAAAMKKEGDAMLKTDTAVPVQ